MLRNASRPAVARSALWGWRVWGFPDDSVVKHPPAVQKTWVSSLGQEDPVEEEMAAHSSTLVWRVPWTEEPGRLQSMGSQRVGHS